MKQNNSDNHIGNIEEHPLEKHNPFSPREQRKAILGHCSLESWNKPIAVSLSMRQSRTTPITLKQWKGLGYRPEHFCGIVRESLDHEKCSQNLRHFMNVINKKVLGVKFRCSGQKLPFIAVIEGGPWKRLHCHAAIDCPNDFDSDEFQTLIAEVWKKTIWGFMEVNLVADCDQGWLGYMMKLRDKEHYDLSIDWSNYFNPA